MPLRSTRKKTFQHFITTQSKENEETTKTHHVNYEKIVITHNDNYNFNNILENIYQNVKKIYIGLDQDENEPLIKEYKTVKNNASNEKIEFVKFAFDLHGSKDNKHKYKTKDIVKIVEDYIKKHKNLRTVEIKWTACYGAQIGIDDKYFEEEIKKVAEENPNVVFLYERAEKDKKIILSHNTLKIKNKYNILYYFYNNETKDFELIEKINFKDKKKELFRFDNLLNDIKKLRNNLCCFSKLFNTKAWQNYQNSINNFKNKKENKYKIFINQHKNEQSYNSLRQLYQEEIENEHSIGCFGS